MNTTKHFSSCVAEYDPNALPVSAAQEIVRQWALPRGRVEVEQCRNLAEAVRNLESIAVSDLTGLLATVGSLDGSGTRDES